MSQTDCGAPNKCTGLIYDIRNGLQQVGPGARTMILFKGCSFSCWWCPNPELQSASVELMVNEGKCMHCGSCVGKCFMEAACENGCTEDEIKRYAVERERCIVCGECITNCAGEARKLIGKRMSIDDVMQQISDQEPAAPDMPRGVILSGGEPLIQNRFVEELLKTCKAENIYTVLDTSGYVPWEVIERVLPWVDLFRFDLKFMDSYKHWEFTGLPNEQILENIKKLSESKHPLILRVPIIPDINDDAENQKAIAAFAASLPNLNGVEIIPYQQIPKYRYERLGKPYRHTINEDETSEAIDHFVQMFQDQGLSAWVSPVLVAG